MHFPGFAERVGVVRERVSLAVARGGHGQQVRLIAVTKTQGPEAVTAALEAGITDIGENKVQEAVGKQEALGAHAGLRWHLIGHLQSNKVKALDRFDLLHALDRPSLAEAVNAFGVKRGRPVEVLVQVNVSLEETKGGYPLAGLEAEAARLAAMPGLVVRGVMTMAPLDAEERVLRRVFAGAREALGTLRTAGHEARELSMGMSQDYEVAVEEGATMVRLGTVLFGARS